METAELLAFLEALGDGATDLMGVSREVQAVSLCLLRGTPK